MASGIALAGLPSNEFSTANDGARGARTVVAIVMGRFSRASLALFVKILATISMETAIGITLASMKSAICPAAIGFAGGMLGAFFRIVMTAGAKNSALLVTVTTLCLLKGTAAIVRTGRPGRALRMAFSCRRSAVARKVVATTAMIQARSVALAGVSWIVWSTTSKFRAVSRHDVGHFLRRRCCKVMHRRCKGVRLRRGRRLCWDLHRISWTELFFGIHAHSFEVRTTIAIGLAARKALTGIAFPIDCHTLQLLTLSQRFSEWKNHQHRWPQRTHGGHGGDSRDGI